MEKFKVVGIGGAGNNTVRAWHNPPVSVVQVAQELDLVSSDLAYILSSDENWQTKLLDSLDDVVCLIAGLGGTLGTEGIQQMAQLAKAQGKTVYAFVTTPFKFEGARRNFIAKDAISVLQNVCDDVFIFPNEELKEWENQRMELKDCFAKRSEQILDSVIRSIKGE